MVEQRRFAVAGRRGDFGEVAVAAQGLLERHVERGAYRDVETPNPICAPNRRWYWLPASDTSNTARSHAPKIAPRSPLMSLRPPSEWPSSVRTSYFSAYADKPDRDG
jgi:hypothetical protein